MSAVAEELRAVSSEFAAFLHHDVFCSPNQGCSTRLLSPFDVVLSPHLTLAVQATARRRDLTQSASVCAHRSRTVGKARWSFWTRRLTAYAQWTGVTMAQPGRPCSSQSRATRSSTGIIA